MRFDVLRAYYDMKEEYCSEVCKEPNDYYVLLHFRNPMIVKTNKNRFITKKDAFVLHSPGSLNDYSLYYGQFRADYICFRVNDSRFLNEFRFLTDEVFYIEQPEYGYKEIASLVWLMVDRMADHTKEINELLFYTLKQLSNRLIETPVAVEHDLISKNRLISMREQVAESPESWTVKAMANASYLSVSSFTIQYKSLFGVTPGDDIRKLTIEKAKKLLEVGNIPIWQISDSLHYANSENFSRAFKCSTGLTPSQYKRNHLIMNSTITA